LQSLNLSDYQLPVIESTEKTSVSMEDNNHYQDVGVVAIE
jgi:hypothetical protein